MRVSGRMMPALVLACGLADGQSFSAPAGSRPAVRHNGPSILPGGRIVAPLGDEYATGPGAFGLAVSPSGRYVVTSNAGPGRNSLSILERQKSGTWDVRQWMAPLRTAQEPEAEEGAWRGVF